MKMSKTMPKTQSTVSQFIEDGIVEFNENVNYDTLEIILKSPKIAATTKPGQFVMLSCQRGNNSLLRRPFSVHDVIGDSISLLYKVVGIGTEMMENFRIGEKVSLLGPLGKSFSVAKTKHHCLVGGGIGMAPLLALAKLIRKNDPEAKITTLQGGQSSRNILVMDKFTAFGDVFVSTDDGTEGHQGYVTGLLEKMNDDDMAVYTCGPNVMMKAVTAIAKNMKWPCQISLEAPMACGMGACLGCSFPRAGDHQGVEKYVHVCKDGPVFKAEEIWD
ncbi:MAG: dihydroorotate dehydrogenase electron transfer subunit [Enterobacterales bacterium]|jgi:dihydroorotate dehydrogenase electron transfer subunit